jgi:hypothetical protein
VAVVAGTGDSVGVFLNIVGLGVTMKPAVMVACEIVTGVGDGVASGNVFCSVEAMQPTDTYSQSNKRAVPHCHVINLADI